MASNEHAYLSEANLHNPKGLSLATNNSLCSKSNDGTLEWVSKSFIKTDTVVSTGYCTLAANYKYSESQVQGQSPYDMNQDYGSATISPATTVLQKKFFKISNNCSSQDSIINKCRIQISGTAASSAPFTIALVKYSPSSQLTQAYPVVLFEKVVTSGASQDLIFTTDLDILSDFTNTQISKGDHLFIMAKGYPTGEERATSVGTLTQITVITEIGYSTN